MKYKVYCRLDIEEYIEVDAKDEDEARFEAMLQFSENIALCNLSCKKVECVECEVVPKEEQEMTIEEKGQKIVEHCASKRNCDDCVLYNVELNCGDVISRRYGGGNYEEIEYEK